MRKPVEHLKRVLAVAALLLGLAGAAPAAAVAHGSHPAQSETGLPAPASDSSGDSSGGGTSPVLIGGLVVGLLGAVGGLIYVRERQRHGGSEPAGRAPEAPSRRARSSW